MYSQLTEQERYTVGAMNRAGFSARQIGRLLKRSHTTIQRELRRNALHLRLQQVQ
ncbi:helix-turn-helix domain-containing protein [Pseudoxanthomonas wuyuanensis]